MAISITPNQFGPARRSPKKSTPNTATKDHTELVDWRNASSVSKLKGSEVTKPRSKVAAPERTRNR